MTNCGFPTFKTWSTWEQSETTCGLFCFGVKELRWLFPTKLINWSLFVSLFSFRHLWVCRVQVFKQQFKTNFKKDFLYKCIHLLPLKVAPTTVNVRLFRGDRLWRHRHSVLYLCYTCVLHPICQDKSDAKGEVNAGRFVLPAESSSVYCLPENASRSKAVSRKCWSSTRWACLFPVAGAAAGPRPTYLKHTQGLSLAVDALEAQNWIPSNLTRRGGGGGRCWRCGAWRSRSNPGSCAPPGTTPGRHWCTGQFQPSPDQRGMERAAETGIQQSTCISWWIYDLNSNPMAQTPGRRSCTVPARCARPRRHRPCLCSCVLGSAHSRPCRCRKPLSSPFVGRQLWARHLGLSA